MRYLFVVMLLLCAPCDAAEPLRVAVAANFRATLEAINRQFEHNTGQPVVVSSASTGVLANQILHGAPFDIFFAADRQTVFKLAAADTGPRRGEPFCYAIGSLVLVGGDGRLAQLDDPGLSLAVANPATAPYGAAAMQVLARPEFSQGRGRKLLRAANVVQAYQFWHSGAAELALLPRALAPAGTPVPGHWHLPLEQFALTLRPQAAHPALHSYLNWIRSDTVRALISEAGYRPCP
ncbi:MAG: molybdate ABC transporter substrate-binding protein [Pseudomonadales bacterium]|nr:molybdate ABC transporter substrate-binding protein [Pseudomonadales bacterium]